jgi:hypothetical protein
MPGATVACPEFVVGSARRCPHFLTSSDGHGAEREAVLFDRQASATIRVMAWQGDLYHKISMVLPAPASVRAHGSVLKPTLLDGWSDLDLHLHLDDTVEIAAIIDPSTIWAFNNVTANGSQVLRTVLVDGRRLDLTVGGPGQITPPTAADDNTVRFIAALAAAKLGRGDQLIGLHLTLGLLGRCLKEAMLLREQDTGTNPTWLTSGRSGVEMVLG